MMKFQAELTPLLQIRVSMYHNTCCLRTIFPGNNRIKQTGLRKRCQLRPTKTLFRFYTNFIIANSLTALSGFRKQRKRNRERIFYGFWKLYPQRSIFPDQKLMHQKVAAPYMTATIFTILTN